MPRLAWDTCPACEGSTRDSHGAKCPACRGTGQLGGSPPRPSCPFHNCTMAATESEGQYYCPLPHCEYQMSVPICPDHNCEMLPDPAIDQFYCPRGGCALVVPNKDHVDQPSDKPRVRISGGPDGSSIEIRNDDGSMFPPIVTGATIRLGHDKLTEVDLTLLGDQLDIEAALSEATENAIIALAQRIRMRRANLRCPKCGTPADEEAQHQLKTGGATHYRCAMPCEWSGDVFAMIDWESLGPDTENFEERSKA